MAKFVWPIAPPYYPLSPDNLNLAQAENYEKQGDMNMGGHDITNVGNVLFATGGAYGSGTVYRYDATITAAKAVSMTDLLPAVTTPTEGSELTVILTASGGAWAVTWSADFHGMAVSTALASGERGIWKFTARADNDWYLCTLPVIA